jgi:hypothetical protein
LVLVGVTWVIYIYNIMHTHIYIYTYGFYIDNIWIKLVDFTMKYMKCGDLIIKVS